MPIETVPFDSAQHLKTKADIARYLEAVLEANDPALRPEFAVSRKRLGKAM
jgi:DNA-binding phage protein